MTRFHYMTARCPIGCEAWLMPSWLRTHRGRCIGHPWVDDLPDEVVVPAPMASLLLPMLPQSIVDGANPPTVSDSRRDHLAYDFSHGYRVRSPVEGVPARRWLRVATAVVEIKGLHAVGRILTPAGFEQLEQELIEPGSAVCCPDCGEHLTTRGLELHRSTSSACGWRQAAAEVRHLWAGGWRDPYNVKGAPLKWSELTATIRWKRRLCTVDFTRWTAVLLKP